MPPKDALDPGPLDGQGRPTFPNLPRESDDTPDWDRLGGERPYRLRRRSRDGRPVSVDPRPSVPHPTTGAPTRPT